MKTAIVLPTYNESQNIEGMIAALLALEIGYNQADAVSKIHFSNNLIVIDLKQDLAGIDRCLLATV